MQLIELAQACLDLIAEGVDPKTKVGVQDHFGKLEDDFDGLEPIFKSSKDRNPAFIALVGVNSKYPEPD